MFSAPFWKATESSKRQERRVVRHFELSFMVCRLSWYQANGINAQFGFLWQMEWYCSPYSASLRSGHALPLLSSLTDAEGGPGPSSLSAHWFGGLEAPWMVSRGLMSCSWRQKKKSEQALLKCRPACLCAGKFVFKEHQSRYQSKTSHLAFVDSLQGSDCDLRTHCMSRV